MRRSCSGLAAIGVAAVIAVGVTGHGEARTLIGLFRRQSNVVALLSGQPDLLEPLAEALTTSIVRALPTISASPGFTYRFDPDTGAFVRETSVLGQTLLERADPLGRHRWNVGVSYQHVPIDTVDGEDIGRLRDARFPIFGGLRLPFFGLDIETHQLTGSASYGITDDLEVNLTVPVLQTRFAIAQRISLIDPQSFAEIASLTRAASATKVGVGDLIVRSKLRVLRRDRGQLAAGLLLRIPTGNEDNFQGTGTVELAPALYASSAALPLGPWARLVGYANGSVNIDTADPGSSEIRWGVGGDCGFGEWATIAVAVLGRHPLRRLAPPGFFDTLRTNPRTGRAVILPLFGLETGRSDFYDLSVGGRVNLWRDTLIGLAAVLIPLNRDGFRSDFVPMVGLEATF
jgi:hypothetical protein